VRPRRREAYRTATIKDTLFAMEHGGNPVRDRAALRERWYAEGWFGETDLAAAFCDADAAEGTVVFAAADSRVSLTRSQIVADARRIARGLIDLGIGPGDVVAIQSPTSPRSLTTMVGTWLCGGVVLPVVTALGPRDLEFILWQSKARALCVTGVTVGSLHPDQAGPAIPAEFLARAQREIGKDYDE